MSNSPLVVYTKLSPNHSGKRTKKIDTITIHCMAGNCSVETCGNLFTNSARQASSNYGIGSPCTSTRQTARGAPRPTPTTSGPSPSKSPTTAARLTGPSPRRHTPRCWIS